MSFDLKHLTPAQLEIYEQRTLLFRELIQKEVEHYNKDILNKRLTKKAVIGEILSMNFGTPLNEFGGLRKNEKIIKVVDKQFTVHEITLGEIDSLIAFDVFVNNPLVSKKYLHLRFRNEIRYFAYRAILKERGGIDERIERVQSEYKNRPSIQAQILQLRDPEGNSFETWKKRIQRYNKRFS